MTVMMRIHLSRKRNFWRRHYHGLIPRLTIFRMSHYYKKCFSVRSTTNTDSVSTNFNRSIDNMVAVANSSGGSSDSSISFKKNVTTTGYPLSIERLQRKVIQGIADILEAVERCGNMMENNNTNNFKTPKMDDIKS
ncbi:uncharacterized protein LOC130624927 [Hydractinia symbiolongicarpus]|uniref:uncharacterized protein LOC130624927 n=1 Tax=Hydractinia symbiolongicarpus TaxID=13093 RepID=UPI00254FF703|nr:uncharacterized protein LOC130624927 [Hydractinia symbiolongicarpus]